MNRGKYFLMMASFLIRVSLLDAQESHSQRLYFHKNNDVYDLITHAIANFERARDRADNEKNYSIHMGQRLICSPPDYISNLPPEIFQAIIKYVPSKGRTPLLAVSKQFRAAVNILDDQKIDTVRLTTTDKTSSCICGLLSTLKLRENTIRALTYLKGKTRNVKHLIISSPNAVAFPLEASYFNEVEEITFEVEPILMGKNISGMNRSVFEAAEDFADRYDLLFEKHGDTRIVVQQIIERYNPEKLNKSESENDFINRIVAFRKEATLLKESANEDREKAPFLSLSELSDHFPCLASIIIKRKPNELIGSLVGWHEIEKFEHHLSRLHYMNLDKNFSKIFADLRAEAINLRKEAINRMLFHQDYIPYLLLPPIRKGL